MKVSAGKRVLMLLENEYYPEDTRVLLEAQALLEAGMQVSVICPGSRKQRWHEVVDGVNVYRYRSDLDAQGALGYVWEYGWSLVASFFLSLLVLVRHGFQVVHVHNPPDTFVLVAIFYKLLGKKFIFDHHDLCPEMYMARFQKTKPGFVYQALVFFERLSCRWADHVIATNGSYKRMEMERSGIPEDRITIVRNGPALDRIYRVEPMAWVREKASTVIGYVGVMGFQDGVDHLLRALKHLVHELGRNDVYCVLIGKGDSVQSLKELTKTLELESHVYFTGWVSQEDLLSYLSAADIFVDPDPASPFNNRSTMIKILEYMAMERPVVAYDLTEHRVSAGDAAVYATPDDPGALAQCIAELIDDPDRCRHMGKIGRTRIESQLKWELQREKLLFAYRQLGLIPAETSVSKAECESANMSHEYMNEQLVSQRT